MPDRKTLQRAAEDKREGKAPSTQAGEFVREEMEHVREGKHGARSAKQAIAIGLSKARRAGVALKPPAKGQASAQTRRSAKLARDAAARKNGTISSRRSRATTKALQREGSTAASPAALSRQAKAAAKKRGPAARSAAARKAARTRSGKG
ncbi:MAG: DNA-binding protein [Casimicrobiaceae bacterium]